MMVLQKNIILLITVARNVILLGVLYQSNSDPNHNVSIGFVVYNNGSKQYILLSNYLGIDNFVYVGFTAKAKIDNSLPPRNIPVGFMVHNVEITSSLCETFVCYISTFI